MINVNESYDNIKHIFSSIYSNVYTANHKMTGKPVVLKSIKESIVEKYGFVKLQNEYDILTKIKSEFVPEAIDYLKIGDDYYLVREYREGIPLGDYIKEHKISIKEFFNIALQIVQALSDIHNAGFIHKDINPANILYSKTGRISIIDFGLATEHLYAKSLNMELDVSEGTLYYISPEQTGRMNHTIDFRSDFYSLGVTFFEMLCGCHPFESESQTQIIYMHLAKLPPVIREINTDVPEMLSRLIYKLMEKMPEDRYLKAEGIIFDLDKCIQMFDKEDEITQFELGIGDYSDHYDIPKKLYGRDNEIHILKSAYQEILIGGKKFVIISGHSGIGKTSLVEEIHKFVISSNVIFISGKFDQYHRNVPYIAISQALEQFSNYILSENKSDIESWKIRLNTILKQDGKLLVDRIPKLGLIVETTQKLPKLTPLEESTRLRAVLQDLLAVIASPQRPLVMFIDDIHLADMCSLEIIDEIMRNENIRGVLIITCYRDNEVDDGHPLILSINKMVMRQVNLQQLSLAGLSKESVLGMISDALHSRSDDINELTSVIYSKTNGNPFYLKQFINLCSRKKVIYFDSATKSWKWNIDAIKTCPSEENVVDFLIRNIEYIPSETIKLLSFGACIGEKFKVNTLSEVSGNKVKQILHDLQNAVLLDVVYPIKFGIGRDEEIEFQFSHDRFQQAFYTILPEKERYDTHYTLGVYYEKIGFENGEYAQKQYIMADNYSKAFSYIGVQAETRRVAEILLRAAHAACVISSFDTAIHYLEQIIDSFTEMKMDEDFALSVYIEYHSALCSIAKYDQADKIYDLLEQLSLEPLRLIDSCCLQVISLSNRGQYKEAFLLGTDVLEKLGVHFPADDLLNTIIKAIGVFYTEINNAEFIGIETLPNAHSRQEFAIGRILNRICTAGFFYNPLYSFWAIITSANRVLENGYTPDGLSLYGSMTLLLIPFRNDYKLSYDLARNAMILAEKNEYRIFRMYHLFSLVNCHWFEDLKNGIPYARESCAGNITVGDFEFACFTYFTTQQIMLETSENINELVAETDSAISFSEKHGNVHAYGSFISFRQLCKSLQNKDSDGRFNDSDFNELNHINKVSGNNMALCFFYILRALSAVIYLDFDTAFDLAEKTIPLMPSITGFYANSLHNFTYSLSMCKKIENKKCTEEERRVLLNKISTNQKWLGERAAEAPVNFQHLYDLIEAERYMIENQGSDSFSVYRKMLLNYEKAIIGASENKRIYHYALCCELAGLQCVKMDSLRLGTVYLKEAYLAYLSWGATAKAEKLNGKHKELKRLRFNSLKFREDLPVSSKYSSTPYGGMHSDMFISNTSAIDFTAIIRASQAISGETKLESILKQLISVLHENSGAQDIYYLTKKENDYYIQAEGHSEGEQVAILHDLPVETGKLPMRILNYVERAYESVIIDDATSSEIYGNDEYILSHHCKSVMCLPVINKGELKGILYLENNLIEGVFNKQRIEALKIIAAQVAISIENSYLFNNLQQLVDERTHELREEIAVRKKAEKSLEQMANNDMFTKLPNRRMFQTCLEHSIELADMNKINLAVLFLDLDGFKGINDKYGHDKGDIVLITTAKRLVTSVRSCDTVSRMGGDEFVIILENVKSIEEIEMVCNRIIASVETPIGFDDVGVQAVVTSSIGISLLNFDGSTAEELITNLDKAMYVANNSGKNQFIFYSEKIDELKRDGVIGY
jgi:diguanylate cyclase (GGDEF) domain